MNCGAAEPTRRAVRPAEAARAAPLLLDTSAAVALVASDHVHHRTTFDAVADRELGLAGHAAFETYSVLTRLPPPHRLTAFAVTRLLADNFPASRFLSAGLLLLP